MSAQLPRAWAWLLLVAVLLGGCAIPPRTPSAPGVQVWNGRLALTVEGQANQSFSAGFELKGAPEAGELTLTNPLGGILAVLQWSPDAATLRSGGTVRQFPSVQALAREATGSELPVPALFDWLGGKATPVPGWEADVTQVAEGRLRARRTDPQPPADLRVLFER